MAPHFHDPVVRRRRMRNWYQKALSPILFSVRKARAWDPVTNTLAVEAMRQADVYVFALLAHRDKATVDPLDLDQWRFYVVATATLNARTRSQHSITLPSLEALGAVPVLFAELADAVAKAAGE